MRCTFVCVCHVRRWLFLKNALQRPSDLNLLHYNLGAESRAETTCHKHAIDGFSDRPAECVKVDISNIHPHNITHRDHFIMPDYNNFVFQVF